MKLLNPYKQLLFILSMLLISFNVFSQTFITYAENKWPDSRYTDHGDGTVTDTKTGLMWQKCGGEDSTLDCTGTPNAVYSWSDALDIASASTLASYTDWRVPNIKELVSLVAYNRYTPAINSTAFPTTFTEYQGGVNQLKAYTTSSPMTKDSNFLYAVDFSFGIIRSGFRTGTDDALFYLRMVRK